MVPNPTYFFDLGDGKQLSLGENKWHELTYFEEKTQPPPKPNESAAAPVPKSSGILQRGRAAVKRMFSDASSPEFDNTRAAKRLKKLFATK